MPRIQCGMSGIPSARAGFMRRLSYYAVGLALGFMLLGLFQKLRTKEHMARLAAQEARDAELAATQQARQAATTAELGASEVAEPRESAPDSAIEEKGSR